MDIKGVAVALDKSVMEQVLQRRRPKRSRDLQAQDENIVESEATNVFKLAESDSSNCKLETPPKYMSLKQKADNSEIPNNNEVCYEQNNHHREEARGNTLNKIEKITSSAKLKDTSRDTEEYTIRDTEKGTVGDTTRLIQKRSSDLETELTNLEDTVGDTLADAAKDTDTDTVNQRKTKNWYKNLRISSITQLSGNLKTLVLTIHSLCVKNANHTTPPINMSNLSELSGIKKSSIKTTLYRLIDMKVIYKTKDQETNRGSCKYTLSNEISHSINLFGGSNSWNNRIDTTQDTVKDTVKDTVQNTTTLSSSRSNVYIHNTTTIELPEEWDSVNIRNLSEVLQNSDHLSSQFFGKAQIKAIYKEAGDLLTAKEVQESIDRFAYGLKYLCKEEPYVSMRKPIGAFVDKLKNGEAWNDSKCLLPDEIRMKSTILKMATIAKSGYNEYKRQWLTQNKENITQTISSKYPSTYQISDSDFNFQADEMFSMDIWPKKLVEIIVETLGKEYENIIERLKSEYL